MFKFFLVIAALIVIPLYPKFPLLGVSGTFVAVRLEDFLVGFILTVWLVSRLPKLSAIFSGSVHRSILLYLFAGLVSLFWAVFVTKSADLNLGLLHAFRRVEYMLVFFAGFDFLQTKSQLNFAIRAFLLVSFCVALYGLGQQFFGLPVISTTNSEFAKGLAVSLGPGARINSTFAGHYDLAAFSMFPLLLIIVLFSLPSVTKKWLLLPPAALIYWTLLLSASRITFAAFFLTAGLFTLSIRKFLWLMPLAVVAVTSMLLSPQLLGRYRELIINHILTGVPAVSAQTLPSSITPPASQPVDQQSADALKPAATPEDRSTNIRLQAEWPRAIRSFIKNPLTGTGFSSIGLAVDNDYLRLLAETGLLGFFAFLLIILRIFKTSWPFIFNPPKDLISGFISAISFSFLGLLLNAVFIDVFEASKIALVTWLLLGLAEKAKVLANKS